jgi:formate hydrogenlyase subunit 6/NADH:ubiquinone oxidoreductase subunit I
VLIKVEDIHAFLKSSVGGEKSLFQEVILPSRAPDGDSPLSFLSRLEEGKELFLEGFRAVDPLKVVLYNIREQVFPLSAQPKRRLIAGVKACDIRALKILDMALINEDFVDPAYKIWRDSSTIMSVDCTDVGPACHCTLVGGKPYAEEGYDLNLTLLDGKYEVVAGSDKGRELMEHISKSHVVQDTDDQIRSAVQKYRDEMTEKVTSQNASFERKQEYGPMRESGEDPWIQESQDCVGCGACTNICPTCYCLILNDEGTGDNFVKVRSYDSCQLHGYARVAGGASPRPHMHQRFRNRYLCKFLYLKENFGELGCTGCGRCTEACPGEIDFRAVVQARVGKADSQSEKANPPAANGRGG